MKIALYNESFTKISEEKRNKILRTATNDFAEHGFQNANINVIAKKSEISIGANVLLFQQQRGIVLNSHSLCCGNLKIGA